jgi:hypothetical protein
MIFHFVILGFFHFVIVSERELALGSESESKDLCIFLNNTIFKPIHRSFDLRLSLLRWDSRCAQDDKSKSIKLRIFATPHFLRNQSSSEINNLGTACLACFVHPE